MARPRINRAIVALVIALLVAVAAYWNRPPDCVADVRAFRGEVWVQPDGKTLHFDGACWTTTPLPPRDMPF